MIRPDVVAYLRENLPRFPTEDLRDQLRRDGIPEEDVEHSLAEARRAAVPPLKEPPRARAAKALMVGGAAMVLCGGLIALTRRASSPPPSAASAPSGESGFVGAQGWVVRLPKDYVGISAFADASKSVEIVHFCKRGTDPTSFLNEGLFGPLGIVRLTVAPSEFPANPTGAANMAAAVTRKLSSHREKYALKNIQIATLRGVEVNIQAPFPRVEAYLLGQNSIYFFYAGQEDDVWRDIVLSLRDTRSEN